MEWILIRGIVSEEFHWWDFRNLLQQKFPNDLVSTPDILGNGRVSQHLSPLRVNGHLEFLRKQVPKRNHKRILIGFSLGGMLALEWAHRFPDEIDGLVLINISLNNSAFYKRMTPFAFKKIITAAMKKDAVERETVVLDLTTNMPPEKRDSIAQVWGPRSAEFPARPINFFRQICVATQIPQRAEPPKIPMLMLSSGKDLVVHPSCSQKIAKKWNLPLRVHESAGHDLTLQDPNWVLNEISNWL